MRMSRIPSLLPVLVAVSCAGAAPPRASGTAGDGCAGLQRVHVSNPLPAAVDIFARVGNTLQIVGSVDRGSSSSFVLPRESSGTPVVRWSGPAGEQSRSLNAVRIRLTCS